MVMIGAKPTKESIFNLGTFADESASEFGGKSGGKKDYCQGFISNNSMNVKDIMSYVKRSLLNVK